MPQIRFNWVDVIFVTLIIRVSYVALKNGFLPEFFKFAGLLVTFIVSFNNYVVLSGFISTHTKWSGLKPDIVSFLFIFFVILLLFKILTVATKMLLGVENLSTPNKLVGLTLGLTRGILLISLIYVLCVNGPIGYLSRSVKERSFSGRYISGIAPAAYRACINFYPGVKNDTPLVKLLEK